MDAIRGVSLEISLGSSLGVVGRSGSGKTTLIDILLGLLRPQSGEIRADGVTITDQRLRSWQKFLGYVPQDIYLTDASVSSNIALGIDANVIDQERVITCAKMASIHDFIETELDQGYETLLGERGVRISGGQRQRIGIARALYHDPEILIFDEATSALDNITERNVIDAIDQLAGRKTIVVIAHRLSTVRSCDQIAVLDRGKIKSLGTYEELLINDEELLRKTRQDLFQAG
jgi:ABC-type bacteriocin/lantibiotic exporter with double-glycine peptidase domain